jgi:cobalt/nickel transport system permease protein
VHIPDGFLSAGVVVATWAAAGTGMAVALHAERRDPHAVPAGVLGATAAFVFAAQMVNLPVAPAISGHLVGAALVSLLMGPWRGLIVMGVVLGVQALLFQDGGIAALGANLTDMGIGGVFSAYAVSALVTRCARNPRGYVIGGVLGAFVATLASAALTALWLALSGLYPLRGILPIMLVTHSAIGVLEGALTGAILATVLRWRPDLVRGVSVEGRAAHPVAASVGVLGVAAGIAAFLAPFASAWPDGLEHVADRLGLGDKAAATWAAPLPDYAVPFIESAGMATALAGLVGVAVTAGLGWLLSRNLHRGHPSHD